MSASRAGRNAELDSCVFLTEISRLMISPRSIRSSCIVSSIHRLHLLDRFDEVIVMHEGRVVAQGPAALLAATSPDFRQLLAMYRQEDRAAQSQPDSAAA